MERLKSLLQVVGSWVSRDPVTILFCTVFVMAWTANAFKLTTFVLAELNGMYATVKGSDLVRHWTDSKLNSPAGKVPGNNEGGKA